MIRTQSRSMGMARAPSGRTLRLPLLQTLSLFFVVLLATGLLVAIYSAPYEKTYDVGSWIAFADQVYEIEEVDTVQYAYSKGDTTLHFPELGRTSYDITLQLAGPGGTHPLEASVDAGYGPLALGELKELRAVHLLGTVDSADNLVVRLDSRPVVVPPDVRPLGPMVVRIAVESLRPAFPPLSMLLGAAATIALLWSAQTLLAFPPRRRIVLVALVGAALAISAVFGRGQVLLVPLWLLLGLSGLLASALLRGEANPWMASWRGVLVLFAGWRVGLSAVAALALGFQRIVYAYGYDNTFYRGSWIPERPTFWLSALVDTWMQWDAVHYASIATSGYTFTNQRWPNIAFFPLYPLAIRALLPATLHNVPAAALLVSHIALLGGLLLLFRIVAEQWSPAIGYRCVLLLLCFPTSFFLIAGYTEALAMALTVATLWAMLRQRYWLAGVAGALLALTRVPGVLIGAAILITYWFQQPPPRRLRPQVLAAALPAVGLGLFMGYQQVRFGTPFAFLEAQRSWSNGSGPPWDIPLALWHSIVHTPQMEMAAFTLLVWAAILALMVVGLRKLPVGYSAVTLLMVPALLAQLPISLTRHVLPVISIFVALALVTQRVGPRWVVVSLMLSGLVALTALFVGGFFVA